MQYRQGATLAAYRRGQDYFTRYAELLGRFADSPARRRLDRVVKRLETAFAQQVRSAKAAEGLTERKHDLRQALRDGQMRLITAIGRADLAPELKHMREFRVPRIRTDDAELLSAARALRHAAAAQPAAFVKIGGLRRTFLNDFDAAIDALQDTIVAREGQLLEHRRHCLAAVGLILQGREVLRMLTSFVNMKFHGTRPDLVGEWKMAIRISEKPGPSRRRRGGG